MAALAAKREAAGKKSEPVSQQLAEQPEDADSRVRAASALAGEMAKMLGGKPILKKGLILWDGSFLLFTYEFLQLLPRNRSQRQKMSSLLQVPLCNFAKSARRQRWSWSVKRRRRRKFRLAR